MTDKKPGPQELMKMIRCSCKESCDKRCSCRKAGLQCSTSCLECLGAFCGNASIVSVDKNENENEDNDITERHFLDVFN